MSASSFDPHSYGAEAAAILALDGSGQRLMPLANGVCSSPAARDRIAAQTARALFPSAYAPDAALAGLWLYFSCLDESHSVSQDVHSTEGSLWHAILHRQEPDPGNSGYWFRRAGAHPIFPALRDRAESIAAARTGVQWTPGATWDPFRFIDACEDARRKPGTEFETAMREIQRAEWQLLFDYCARPRE